MVWKFVHPPADEKLLEVQPTQPPRRGKWNVYRHPLTGRDSPLWQTIVVVGPQWMRRKMGRLRKFWLYWGIDEGRFRNSKHRFRFEQEQPEVFAAVVEWCKANLTPEWTRLNATKLSEERLRLKQLKVEHLEHDERRRQKRRLAESLLLERAGAKLSDEEIERAIDALM